MYSLPSSFSRPYIGRYLCIELTNGGFVCGPLRCVDYRGTLFLGAKPDKQEVDSGFGCGWYAHWVETKDSKEAREGTRRLHARARTLATFILNQSWLK